MKRSIESTRRWLLWGLLPAILVLQAGCSPKAPSDETAKASPVPAGSATSSPDAEYSGKRYAQWRDELKATDPVRRADAVSALRHFPSHAEESLRFSIAAIRDPEPLVRVTALDAVGRAGPDARQALPDLLAALEDERLEVRLAAAAATLSVDASLAEKTTPAIAAGLQSEDARLKLAAMAAVGQLGKRAPNAIPALENALEESSPEVRFAAKRALESVR